MGLFDSIRIYDGYTEDGELVPNEHFKCKEGHKLHDLQSKDFGCTMGHVEVYPEQVLFSSGYFGTPEEVGTGIFQMYGTCTECLAEKGGQPWDFFSLFLVILKDWHIISVESLPEFVEDPGGSPTDANRSSTDS